MPITSVDDWSTTANLNSDVNGNNIAENCSPAGINNAMREMMAQVAATPLAETAATMRANLGLKFDFDTVALLIADTVRTYSNTTAGDYIRTRAEGFAYLVAASGASDHHVTTGGGLKLYVLPVAGAYHATAFGAVGDWNGTQSVPGTGTDNTIPLQKAVDVAVANGTRLYFQKGRYRTTSAIIIDRTINIQDPINGGMFGISLEGASAASCQIVADHDGKCIDFRGGLSSGWHTYFNVSGVGILKADYGRDAGSVGVSLSDCAFFSINRFDIYGFEYGIDGEDCLSGSFEDGTIRGNSYGWRFQKGTRSHPNNISFRGVATINNIIYGGSAIKPSVLSYIGGSIESNGYTGTIADPISWGVYIESAGQEGCVGVNMQGVYIENNNGKADVWILQTTNNAIHNFNGCSFLRLLDTRYVTNCILFNSTNESRIALNGCGFKDFAPYVSSGARLFVATGDSQVIDGGGNIFLDTAAGNVGITRSIYSPIATNHQIPFASLPDVVKYRNGIQYCSDGTGSSLPAIAVSDGVRWWQIPLGQFCGRVASAGTALRLPRGWSCTRTATGVYVITHNLAFGANTYGVTATPSGAPGTGFCSGMVLSSNTFEIYFANTAGAATNMDFNFTMTVI